MQAVPAKAVVLGLAVLICVGTLALGILRPGRAAADDLDVTALVVQSTGDQVELHLTWHWSSPSRSGNRRHELLAVTFDTRRLVFDSDEAPAGRGSSGALLRRLEQLTGPDGARLTYVIPNGKDGTVVVRFRSVHPGLPASGSPIRIHVLLDSGNPSGWAREIPASAL